MTEYDGEVPTNSLVYTYGKRPDPATAPPLPAAPTGPVQPGLAVLVLCAGKKMKWEGGAPRQLRRVAKGDPETVLARIVRQVKAHGHEPIIITQHEYIEMGAPDVEHFEPERRRTIAETWLYTRELWRAQTAILLGDVIYGQTTIEKTLAHRGSMMMVGNSAEIFAFTFSSDEHDRLAKGLYQVNMETLKGAAWEIYWMWCGAQYKDGRREKKVFKWTWDRTADLDCKREYDAVLKVDWGK